MTFVTLPGVVTNILATLNHSYLYLLLLFRDVAQPGSALRSGRRGRWFESSHPDST